MPESKFQIGDTVTWTSQAGGNAKTKTGKVIAIVPANRDPRMVRIGDYNLSRLPPFSSSRDHESYLVQVGKSKRLYWPLVKYLEKVIDPEMAEMFQSVTDGITEKAKSFAGDWQQHTPIPETDPEDDDPMMLGEGCGSDD